MPKEIEYKYLVLPTIWNFQGQKQHIIQGYLSTSKETTIRIRICDDKAYLTIKNKKYLGYGDEFEYAIPHHDALEMLEKIIQNKVISKDRYFTIYKGTDWTVDVFDGENKGLILAEIEIQNQPMPNELPPWIDKNVTDNPKYFNSYLIDHPYTQWDNSHNSESK